jgi:hypothetical protein
LAPRQNASSPPDEFVEERADVALQLFVLAQAEELEGGDERVCHLGHGRVDPRRRRLDADCQQPEPVRRAPQRQKQRRLGLEPGFNGGDLLCRLRHHRRRRSCAGLRQKLQLARRHVPRLGGQLVRAICGRGVEQFRVGVEFEQDRAGAASDLERLPMQLRQHVEQAGASRHCGQKRESAGDLIRFDRKRDGSRPRLGGRSG